MDVHGTLVFVIVATWVAIGRTDADVWQNPCVGQGVVLTAASGTIQSPGFSYKKYPNDTRCYWRIVAPPGKKVKIKFTYIQLEEHSQCNYDSVSLYDYSTGVPILIGRYCGSELPSVQSYRSILVAFFTDKSINCGGFSLTWCLEDACGENLWALIVAGSRGWLDYRHQADVCHAYHIVRKNGIPEDHIVTMMYNDIAFHPQNPTPGVIINKPGGPNVYEGVQIDYREGDVTPNNFLAALSGNEERVVGGNGKVIKSGPYDHIFVFFSDHGAPGILCFPNENLKATDLINTISWMHSNGKYGKMVFYIEACNAGSMFHNLLPNDTNVYATTASNPFESSYAHYWDDAVIAWLGDEYSVNWMEDSDEKNLCQETLQEQYEIVREATINSHVMQYGDQAIASDAVGDFQGNCSCSETPPPPGGPVKPPKEPGDEMPSEWVHVSTLYRQLILATDRMTIEKLRDGMLWQLQLSKSVDDTMKAIASRVAADQDLPGGPGAVFGMQYPLTAYPCYETVVDLFDQRCFRISQNDYARKKLYVLVNLCEEGVPAHSIMNAIVAVCNGV